MPDRIYVAIASAILVLAGAIGLATALIQEFVRGSAQPLLVSAYNATPVIVRLDIAALVIGMIGLIIVAIVHLRS